MMFPLIEFPSSMFTWNGSDSACCDASDLGNRHLQPLYDDANDSGFAMVSSKTGRVVKLYMCEANKNAEGETTSWSYKVCREDVRVNPGASFLNVTVFND